MNVDSKVRPALIHPLSIAAVGLLLLNDHVLKHAWPGALTGKLSDFAGLVFFPGLLVYLASMVIAGNRRMRITAILTTGVVFSLIQVWEPAADLYRFGLGVLQFPFRIVVAGADTPVLVTHTADPTDLIALPALLLAWWAGQRSDAARTTTIGRAEDKGATISPPPPSYR